jgi:hypothetical protein
MCFLIHAEAVYRSVRNLRCQLDKRPSRSVTEIHVMEKGKGRGVTGKRTPIMQPIASLFADWTLRLILWITLKIITHNCHKSVQTPGWIG